MVFRYYETPDFGSGIVELGLVPPEVPHAVLELVDLAVAVFLHAVVVEKLSVYVRKPVFRPYLHASQGYWLDVNRFLVRMIVDGGCGLRRVVHQEQSTIVVVFLRIYRCWREITRHLSLIYRFGVRKYS